MATNNGNGNQNQLMDLNEASVDDIANLPFMNKERARLITDYINTNGPLESIEQVDNVPGIGDKLSELIAQHFTVNEGNSNNRQGGRGRSQGNADDIGQRLSDDNRGGSRQADASDGRHNNPGRPAGIPRDAEYSNDSRGNSSNNSRGGSSNSRGGSSRSSR